MPLITSVTGALRETPAALKEIEQPPLAIPLIKIRENGVLALTKSLLVTMQVVGVRDVAEISPFSADNPLMRARSTVVSRAVTRELLVETRRLGIVVAVISCAALRQVNVWLTGAAAR